MSKAKTPRFYRVGTLDEMSTATSVLKIPPPHSKQSFGKQASTSSPCPRDNRDEMSAATSVLKIPPPDTNVDRNTPQSYLSDNRDEMSAATSVLKIPPPHSRQSFRKQAPTSSSSLRDNRDEMSVATSVLKIPPPHADKPLSIRESNLCNKSTPLAVNIPPPVMWAKLFHGHSLSHIHAHSISYCIPDKITIRTNLVLRMRPPPIQNPAFCS